MNIQSKTLKSSSEEYMKTSSKWFTKSAITMAEMYNKQFKSSYDMYSNFLNTGSNNEKNKSIFSSDLIHTNIELLRTNIENISKLSEKTISTFLNYYSDYVEKENKQNEGIKIVEAFMKGYHLQTTQIADINNRFFDAFSKTFKKSNEDIDKSYANFKKKIKDNFYATEKAIDNALKSYTSSINKSDKTRQELFDNINSQMEILIKNNLKQWSDLSQTVEKENKMSKDKENQTINKIKKPHYESNGY